MAKGGRRSTTWQPAWNLGKTKVIRIPEVIADELMEIARHMDNGGKCLLQGNSNSEKCRIIDNVKNNQYSHVTGNRIEKQLKEILEKVDNKESGFKVNSFGQGIRELKRLLDGGD